MAKRKKTIRAGCLVKTVLYTPPEPRDCPRARAEKSKATSAARKLINDKTAKGRLEMLLAANFQQEDEFVTLTYDEEHLPKNRAQAADNIKKYIRRLRNQWRRQGEALRYVCVTENVHGEGRFHHHIVLSALSENDIETIRSLWSFGKVVDVKRVEGKEFDHWANYMTKESGNRPLGKRMWTCSKGLLQPTIEYETVSNDTALTVPLNCHILEKEERVTEFGSYAYIKYKITLQTTTKRKPRHQEYRACQP